MAVTTVAAPAPGVQDPAAASAGAAAYASPTSSAVGDLQATSQQQLQDMAAIAAIQMEYALKQNLIQAVEKMVTHTAKFVKDSTSDATG
jgi:hypothetical protein